MKSRNQDDLSSLDLLLDTICNTFGGIVFLALLLSIIAQSAGEASRPISPEYSGLVIETLAEDLSSIENEIQRLESMLADHPLDNLPVEIREVFMQFEQKNALVTGQEAVLQQEREHAYELRQDVLDLEQKIAQLTETIEQTKRNAVENRRLPVQQQAPRNMTHFWAAMYEGKIYLVDALPSSGRSGFMAHSDQVESRRAGDRIIITPIQDAGLVIDPEGRFRQQLDRWLAELPPDRYILRFMVCEASFAAFNTIKELIVQKGYRYYIVFSSPPYAFSEGTPGPVF